MVGECTVDVGNTSEHRDLVGRRIVKQFDCGLCEGTVDEYLPPQDPEEVPLWQIRYDDGDFEQFDVAELLEGLSTFEAMERLSSIPSSPNVSEDADMEDDDDPSSEEDDDDPSSDFETYQNDIGLSLTGGSPLVDGTGSGGQATSITGASTMHGVCTFEIEDLVRDHRITCAFIYHGDSDTEEEEEQGDERGEDTNHAMAPWFRVLANARRYDDCEKIGLLSLGMEDGCMHCTELLAQLHRELGLAGKASPAYMSLLEHGFDPLIAGGDDSVTRRT